MPRHATHRRTWPIAWGTAAGCVQQRRPPRRDAGRRSLGAACSVLAVALVLSAGSSTATAEDREGANPPRVVIPWEHLQVGPLYKNPISKVRVVLYESVDQLLPADEETPPLCDVTYTRDKHKSTIKRFEFGLSNAFRVATPGEKYYLSGGFEVGQIHVTAEKGPFVISVLNLGYTFDLRRYWPDAFRRIETFRRQDVFFSPLLTREIDAAGTWRMRHHLHQLLSGQGLMRSHDRFLYENP